MMLSLTSTRQMMFLVGLLLLAIFPFFFIGGPSPFSAPLFRSLWDCGHIVFFAGLVVIAHTKFNIAGWRPFFVISLIAVAVGGAIEIIQAHTGREGNWQDLLNDLAATWLALFWLQKSNLWVWGGRVAAIALLIPPITTVFFSAWAQLHAERNFPILANFESSIDLHGWRGNVERTNALRSAGEYSLKVHLNTEKYAGAALTEFYHSWQGYSALAFDIYNPESLPIDLVIRISDLQHELGDNDWSDRFNKKLHITNGWNSIEIPVASIQQAPLTRELEMDSITSIVIFSMQLAKPQDIYVDNILLK
jgi:VanZ family protein